MHEEEILHGTLREVASKIQALREDVIELKTRQEGVSHAVAERISRLERGLTGLDVLVNRLEALEAAQGRTRDIITKVVQTVLVAALAGGLGVAF